MKINVGFIFGGISTEHEISIISALQAMNNIDKDKYEIVAIYISKDGNFYTGDNLKNIETFKNLKLINKNATEVVITKKDNSFCLMKKHIPYNIVSKIDIFFPVLHGYNTEDGSIAGFLETIGAPYCESDLYASAIGQDKVFQKAVLKENGINVVPYYYFYESDYLADSDEIIKNVSKLKYPVIVKPARQGSSVGISVVNNKNNLCDAIEEALNYDEKIIVEKVIENLKELNCSVLGDNSHYEASLIEQVYSSDEILSFKDKYLSNGKSKGMASTGRKVPADISKKLTSEIQDISIKACKALNTTGVVRIDYLLDEKTNEVYLNELNIIPGSLSFYLWTPTGISYKDMLSQIIDLGIKKYQNKSKKSTSFESNVLEGFNGSKGVKK